MNFSLGTVKLNAEWSSIESLIGPPLKTTSRGEYTVHWYTTATPGDSDLAYIRKNKVSLVSVNVESRQKSVTDYINTYQQPTATYLVDGRTNFSDQQNLVVWAADGIAVFSLGTSTSGHVTRELHFNPTTSSALLSDFFPQYLGSKETVLGSASATLVPAITITPRPETASGSSSVPMSQTRLPRSFVEIGIGLITVVLVVSVLILLFFRRKRSAAML